MEWTKQQNDEIATLYPQRAGLDALCAEWPLRSRQSINAQAYRLGVHGPRKRRSEAVDMNMLLSKSKRNDVTGCIEWQWVTLHGYGIIRINGHNLHVHRLAFSLLNPSVDLSGRYVCHHCDNPPCINPDHLYAGTPSDNVADMMRRGRFNLESIQGERNVQAKLTEVDVRAIKHRLQLGESAYKIAKDYPVNDRIVRNIRDGTKWRHVA